MISTYAATSKGGAFSPGVLSIEGKINHQGFTRFVEELAKREHWYILDQATPKADRRGNYLDKKFDNHTLLKHVQTKILRNGKEEKSLNFQGYRADYYDKMGISTADDDVETPKVRKLCLDYLRAIAWVFEYYIVSLPSWRDFYAWHYAPLMTDLAQVMKSATKKELQYIYQFKMDTAPLPFVQLLSVLPPASANFLPECYRGLLTSKNSPLVKLGYYPPTFKVDLEGKTKEHMGVVLLPFVDPEKVEEAYLGVKTKNKYVRNSVGKLECFVYDKNWCVKYVSDYGKIEKSHVKKTSI